MCIPGERQSYFSVGSAFVQIVVQLCLKDKFCVAVTTGTRIGKQKAVPSSTHTVLRAGGPCIARRPTIQTSAFLLTQHPRFTFTLSCEDDPQIPNLSALSPLLIPLRRDSIPIDFAGVFFQDTESNFDFVTLWDGKPAAGFPKDHSQIWRGSGSHTPAGYFTASGSTMVVEFVSVEKRSSFAHFERVSQVQLAKPGRYPCRNRTTASVATASLPPRSVQSRTRISKKRLRFSPRRGIMSLQRNEK